MNKNEDPLYIETEEEFRERCLSNAGITYSAAAILPVLLSFVFSFIVVMACGSFGTSFIESKNYPDWYIYCIYLLPQLAFLGAAAIYFFRTREPIKVVCPRCKPRYFLIALLLQFGLLFSLSDLNTFFIMFLESLGYRSSGLSMPNLSGWNLLPAILVIALVPAVMEEVLFRGILSRNMNANGWGLACTVVISGAMFSLFHGNPEQTVYQFLCGMCFTLIALRSGSILPTMCAHFLNNALILILTSCGVGDLWQLGWGYLAIFVISLVCLVGTLVYLIFFDKNNSQKGGVKAGKVFFVAAAVGIVICAAEWVYALVTGFYA